MPIGERHSTGSLGAVMVTFLPTTLIVTGALAIFVAPLYKSPLYVPGATAAAATAVNVSATTSAPTAAERRCINVTPSDRVNTVEKLPAPRP